MSTPRPYPRAGPSQQIPNGENGGSTQPAYFSDFREFKRRHSMQNREVIQRNVAGAMQNKVLTDEIAVLQVKLMQERASKAAMGKELKLAMDELARIKNNDAREALDTLLASVPVLENLRRQLGDQSSQASRSDRYSDTDPRMTSSRAAVKEWHGRYHMAQVGRTDLDAVTEATESDGGNQGGGHAAIVARRRISFGQVTNKYQTPSPEPDRTAGPSKPTQITGYSTIVSAAILKPRRGQSSTPSPSSSISQPYNDDIPKVLTSAERARAKRRQSGIFPRTASLSPEIEMAPIRAEGGRAVDKGKEKEKRKRRSELFAPGTGRGGADVQIELDPREVGEIEGIDGVLGGMEVGKEVDEMQAVREVDDTDLSRSVLHTTNPSIEILSSNRRTERADSPVPELANLSLVTLADDGEGGDDGRKQRRVRKSVNYREPSLNVKMRKPDGTSFSSTLNLPTPTDPNARARSTTPSTLSMSPKKPTTPKETPKKTPKKGSKQEDESSPAPPVPAARNRNIDMIRAELGWSGDDDEEDERLFGPSGSRAVFGHAGGSMRKGSAAASQGRRKSLLPSQRNQTIGRAGGLDDEYIPKTTTAKAPSLASTQAPHKTSSSATGDGQKPVVARRKSTANPGPGSGFGLSAPVPSSSAPPVVAPKGRRRASMFVPEAKDGEY